MLKRRPRSPRTATASLQGLRDAAIIRVMSDTLARIGEIETLQVADVEADTTGGGTVLIRASKSDQQGEGATRYVGPTTLAAINRYLEAAGHAAGPLFRQVRRGGHASADPLGADSIRAIVRRRAAAVDGIAGRIGGTRSGAAMRASLRLMAPASRSYSRRVGGSRPPRQGLSYINRYGSRAVVGRVEFVRHCVHAGTVVVRSGGRRRGHVRPVAPGSRSRKPSYRGRAHLGVGCGDRRVCRLVEAQRRGG